MIHDVDTRESSALEEEDVERIEIESDESLYRGYMNGREEGLTELMERHGNGLTLYINGYIRDIHEAEGLMVEAFARVIAKRPKFEESGFKAYLFKTGRNLAFRHSAKRKRFGTPTFLDEEEDHHSEELVESILEAEERNRILLDCMNKITVEYREVLYLLYFEDMSYEEAGRIMGKTKKQIANLAYRGKHSLRPLLCKEGITNAKY